MVSGYTRFLIFARRRPSWAAGLALVLAGVLCLCLSGIVVQGWWQGTLDAFGVGFIVGGLVDVIAISALNEVITREQNRPVFNRQAREILDGDAIIAEAAVAGKELLRQGGSLIDPPVKEELRLLIEEAEANATGNEEARRRLEYQRQMRRHFRHILEWPADVPWFTVMTSDESRASGDRWEAMLRDSQAP